MVAAERRDPAGEHDALARALTQYAGDPHLAAASEWLLGRLHAVGRGDRRTLAELLPLAISHCMSGWGGSLIRDLMRRVHDEWEVPSFMTSRGRFRGGDPASHAESLLVFGFWTARPDLLEQAVRALLAGERLRPHHLADAVFSLLELGKPHRARELLDRLDLPRETASDPRCERVLLLARSAILAALGNPQEGERIFARVVPDPSDRIYNSARLAQARAYFELGMPSRTFKLLRPLGGQERFSREHKAWFHLRCGDLQGASRQLRPLLERNDHRRGKNLSNFLYGTLLIRGGREEEAREVFSCLPRTAWPRTWTIGSHYALGRLGGGRLETYLAEAFPYERKCLLSHAELLAEARGQTRDALPRVLLS
jgi:hypothetical protein